MSPEQARGKPVDPAPTCGRSAACCSRCSRARKPSKRRHGLRRRRDGLDEGTGLDAVLPIRPRLAVRSVAAAMPRRRIPRSGFPTSASRGSRSTKARTLNSREGLKTVAPPARPLWKRSAPVVAAVAVTAAVIAGAFWSVRSAPPTPRIARFTIALPADQQFTNAGRQLVAISPDGSQMVYVANQRLYLRSVSDTEVRPIQGTDSAGPVLNPVFSPDGRSIAF